MTGVRPNRGFRFWRKGEKRSTAETIPATREDKDLKNLLKDCIATICAGVVRPSPEEGCHSDKPDQARPSTSSGDLLLATTDAEGIQANLAGQPHLIENDYWEKQFIQESVASQSNLSAGMYITPTHITNHFPFDEAKSQKDPAANHIGSIKDSEEVDEKDVVEDRKPRHTSFFDRFISKPRDDVTYHPDIHGPLVDLTFRPFPGIEEVEVYHVHPPYASIRILYDVTSHEYTYQVLEPLLTPGEEDLYTEIKNRLFETLDISTRGLSREETRRILRNASTSIIDEYEISLHPVEKEKILYRMDREFLGDGLIDPIMHDPFIEDISCDGLKTPIFVYHTRYESMKTSLAYNDAAELDSFVTKLAQRAGKYISIADPILDATMSDGSRIQMTLGTEVTAHGSTFTIRKFREEPITPTDLIEWKTFSPLSIAFLWLVVESGKSCLFAGGTASGKTTSLNAISLFMPPLAKIITLEDTRELKLPHANWIPSVTRDSFDTGGRGEIDLYELLRAALRQRPEYLLVGEVRGREALTLFQAMSTGHITYSTIHADSVSSVVHRLENPPMNVPRNMLSALNLVSVQIQARVGGQRIRRNKQIIEILDIDPRTNELITNEVFRWKPTTDEITYLGKSYVLEDIMEERGWDAGRMQEELKRRQEVLEWMKVMKIRHYQDVSAILMEYFRNPDDVISRVRSDLHEQL